jgi:ABC-type transport system involved in multi-copper enzyme maturation permease subunit
MKAKIDRVFSLGFLVFIDGMRRHALLGLLAMSLLLEIAGLFFFGFVPRDIGRVVVDYAITVGWATGMVFLLFHAVQVMSWGEDRRIIQLLLSHPLSRTEYVSGVFTGLALLLVLLNSLLGVGSYGVLLAIKAAVGIDYFSHLGLLEYLLAWGGVFLVEFLMLAAIVVFSGLVRGGFSVLLLSISYYLICNGLPVALEYFKEGAAIVKNLLVGLTYFFPNFDRWDYKGLVVVIGEFPPLTSLLMDVAYIFLYCVLSIALAAKIYSVRDIK